MMQERDLKFTIITPSYNQGAFIEETICSVLQQDYKNFEYFIIDGGSTDSTVDLIKKFENQISYWASEKDSGQSNALNKGLQRATGDILIWINSDDLLKEGALRTVSDYFLRNPTIDVVHGGTVLFQDEGEQLRGIDNKNLPEQYLSGMAFPQPSAFIRLDALKKYCPRLNESLHYGMDYDLFACLYLNVAFLNIPEILSKYRLHENSKTIVANERFAREWQEIFCRIITSLKGHEDIIKGLVDLNMWHSASFVYPVSKSFSSEFIKKSFQQFLYFQMKFYYRSLNLKQIRKIAKFIKRKFPEFYQTEDIKRIHLISSVPFARYLIPLLRKSSL